MAWKFRGIVQPGNSQACNFRIKHQDTRNSHPIFCVLVIFTFSLKTRITQKFPALELLAFYSKTLMQKLKVENLPCNCRWAFYCTYIGLLRLPYTRRNTEGRDSITNLYKDALAPTSFVHSTASGTSARRNSILSSPSSRLSRMCARHRRRGARAEGLEEESDAVRCFWRSTSFADTRDLQAADELEQISSKTRYDFFCVVLLESCKKTNTLNSGISLQYTVNKDGFFLSKVYFLMQIGS